MELADDAAVRKMAVDRAEQQADHHEKNHRQTANHGAADGARKQHGNLPVAATHRRAAKSIEGVSQRQGRPSGPLGARTAKTFLSLPTFRPADWEVCPILIGDGAACGTASGRPSGFRAHSPIGRALSGTLGSRARCEPRRTPPRKPASRSTSVPRSPRRCNSTCRLARWLRKPRSSGPTPFGTASRPSSRSRRGRVARLPPWSRFEPVRERSDRRESRRRDEINPFQKPVEQDARHADHEQPEPRSQTVISQPQPSPARRSGRLLFQFVSGRACPHLHGDDGDVVRAAAQIGEVHEQAAGLLRRQFAGDDADFRVLHVPGQPVGAQDINVAGQNRVRPFDVDLHVRLRAQRTRDHVPRFVQKHVLGAHPPLPHRVPNAGCDRT